MAMAETLLKDIETKRTIIRNSPDYYLRRSKILENSLRNLCNVYSFWLENPRMRRAILESQREIDARNLRTIARKEVKRIESAWDYLKSLKCDGSFLSALSPEIIIRTGQLVSPDTNYRGFRTDRVTLTLQNYTPPNPVKVPEMVEQACSEIKASDYAPVEAAAAIHLRIAGIQPFLDGNKRTARLLQDRILDDSGLPPAVIPAGEREVYLDLLEQGLIGMRDKNLKQIRPFFDYIGGKVNVSLDNVINDLRIH